MRTAGLGNEFLSSLVRVCGDLARGWGILKRPEVLVVGLYFLFLEDRSCSYK